MNLKWLIAKETLWIFFILLAVIAFWLLATLIIWEGLTLYYLQGLLGNSNEANVRESRLMTVIPVLVVYGILLVVRVIRGTQMGRQT